MATKGIFHPEAIKALNKLLKKYPLAPGPGHNDECTYYTGRYNKKNKVVDDWVSVDCVDDESWGTDFMGRWNLVKDLVLFTGEIFVLERPKSFIVGDYPYETVRTSDRVVRAVRKGTNVSVLKVLGHAYYTLFDSEKFATNTQGTIGSIEVKENANIPTLIFNW